MVIKTSIHPQSDRRLIRHLDCNLSHTYNSKDQSLSGLRLHKKSKKNIVVRSSLEGSAYRSESEEADDVIDLGAPRCVCAARPARASATARARTSAAYTPNPRLYPGRVPQARREPKPRQVQGSVRRRRKSCFRRVVPNSRLYRPAPPRPPPPPARPRTSWPPPATSRTLDTASRVALHVQLSRRPHQHRQPQQLLQPHQHLEVRLPAGAEAMSAAHRAPPTPEDRSDGNDASSAPSEFLAEFLSAIMRREYAEALKYCQLILQYEPHNATARGFYPLLKLKVKTTQEAGSSSSSARCVGGDTSHSSRSPHMSHSSHSSLASQSSLELDSSDQSEPSDSPPRTTDGSAGSAGSAGWGTASGSASPDDNGNTRPPHADRDDTDENDNAAAAAGDTPAHAACATHATYAAHTRATHARASHATNKTEGGAAADASLRRLRAHFAAAR